MLDWTGLLSKEDLTAKYDLRGLIKFKGYQLK